MSDVLFVCVREDVPEAEALAEVFESAGFSVDDFSEESLGDCGACVVVWSAAAQESTRFHEAFRRAVDGGKAVIAGLLSPIAITGAPAFDLSLWNGDPDDNALDMLFETVDRMATAEAAVGDETPIELPEAFTTDQVTQLRPPALEAGITLIFSPARAPLTPTDDHDPFHTIPAARSRFGRALHVVAAFALMFGAVFTANTDAGSASSVRGETAQTELFDASSASVDLAVRAVTLDELLSPAPLPAVPEVAWPMQPEQMAFAESAPAPAASPVRSGSRRVVRGVVTAAARPMLVAFEPGQYMEPLTSTESPPDRGDPAPLNIRDEPPLLAAPALLTVSFDPNSGAADKPSRGKPHV